MSYRVYNRETNEYYYTDSLESAFHRCTADGVVTIEGTNHVIIFGENWLSYFEHHPHKLREFD